MAGSERLRLFLALRLPDETCEQIAAWQAAELHGGRAVARENLHVTLAFLGTRPAAEVPVLAATLRSAVAGTCGIRLRVRGYRETRSVGMLTFDDEGGRAALLAGRLHDLLEELGLYRREARPWLPHVTVLRFREPTRLDPVLPELGEVSPSDAAVYSSLLRSDGARYDVLAVEVLSRCRSEG